MRIGAKRRLEGALPGCGGELRGLREKAAGLSGCCPDQERGLRPADTGEGRTARNGCPTVALRYKGRVDSEEWLFCGGVGMEGTGGWQDTENIEIIYYINKLDKDTLNLYTAPRAYGSLEPGAASPGRSTRGWQIREAV